MHLIRLYCKLLLVASVFFENGTWNRSVYAASSSDEYLYHTEEAANIIIDHEPPKGATDKELITPDFIYAPNQGPRVVEFYAPWCPHCQHFRSHYIKFAKQVTEIMTEFGVEGPPVKFYAVSCTANRKLCKSLGISGYPKIKVFAAGAQQNATADVVYWKLHAFDVLDTLKIQVQHLQLDKSKFETGMDVASDATGNSNKIQLRSKSIDKSSLERTKKQVFDDAYLSFDFNLRNAIFVQNGPLTNQTKLVLREWLELVRQTTPVVWQIRTVINNVLNDFEKVVSNEEALLQILDQYPPPNSRWSPACTKGVSGMGYSCGLWQLFHIISVGLVEYNLMIGSADDIVLNELSLTTTHAAETIRNFVEYFFACDVCRMNFISAYDACALDRCHRLSDEEMDSEQWIQFPIWLYETHNAVNVRLLHEKAQREHRTVSQNDEIEARWPSRKACPVCWLESDGWDEENVYKYLRTEYWSEDAIATEYRAEISSALGAGEIPTDDSVFRAMPLLQLLEWGAVMALIGVWYTKRVQHIRSGLHKKRDSEC